MTDVFWPKQPNKTSAHMCSQGGVARCSQGGVARCRCSQGVLTRFELTGVFLKRATFGIFGIFSLFRNEHFSLPILRQKYSGNLNSVLLIYYDIKSSVFLLTPRNVNNADI